MAGSSFGLRSKAAETNALAKIDFAHDVGLHNQSGFRKFISGAVKAVGDWVHKGIAVDF